MSAFSPGGSPHITPSPKVQSTISSYSQQHPINRQALGVFSSIVRSCYGPNGQLKMIQNQSGGHVTMTSASRRLLGSLSLSKPILKLIAAAVEEHLKVYSDGGLYAAVLMCTVIEGCWKSNLHPVLCVTVNELMQDLCIKSMMSNNVCRMPIDVASVDAMMSLVQSVIGTKQCCGMSQQDVHYISSLVLQSFISSMPDDSGRGYAMVPRVEIVGVEARKISSSHVIGGILVEAPEIPTSFTKNIKPLRLHEGSENGSIRVALFNISLAGDSDEFLDVKYELSPGLHLHDATLQAMRGLADKLANHRVGLVACQKVIHPSIRQYLRSKGILSLDRLSLMHIGAVQRITGAQILSSLNLDISPDCFGHLTDIKHHVMFDKSYLHLTNTSSTMCTLVLCNRREQALEELKHVCQTAHHVLGLTLSDPAVFPGAGCLELILAHQVRKETAEMDGSVWQDIGCTKTMFNQLAENFASCLESVAGAIDHDGSHHVTDSVSHHRWPLPPGSMADSDWLERLSTCGCGMRTANELGDSRWSISGKMKCGDYKMEKEENEEGEDGDGDDDGLNGRTKKDGEEQTSEERSSAPLANNEIKKHLPGGSYGSKSQHQDTSNSRTNACKVFDCCAVKLNAFRIAVETANMILRIGHTIEDVN